VRRRLRRRPAERPGLQRSGYGCGCPAAAAGAAAAVQVLGAGTTAQCINDTVLFLKGAENKFTAAIRKACDPTFKAGTDCPECYSGGDCSQSGEANDRVQNIEGQVDSFGPGVYCEQTGIDKLESACQQNTAKTLVKLVGSLNKCHDKCRSNLRKGVIAPGSCDPAANPTDPATAACLNTANGKALAGVNKKCRAVGESAPGANDGTTAVPDCNTPNDYPDGAFWVNLVDLSINGNVPGTYCGSPSGAFLN
jgi:hypothetical protein